MTGAGFAATWQPPREVDAAAEAVGVKRIEGLLARDARYDGVALDCGFPGVPRAQCSPHDAEKVAAGAYVVAAFSRFG